MHVLSLLKLVLLQSLLALFVVLPAFAQQLDEQAPVDLVADRLENDENAQTVTAIGNVELVQAGRILKADRVSYNLVTDTVTAQGNVVLNEVTGEVYFADEVELTDQMKDGFATGVKGLLTDGGRFSATQGQRIGGTKLVMEEATYTACEPCKSNPDKAPVWQLVASKVTHNEEEKRIEYENARFEMFGLPVLYTPYFSHPDGSVDQKSGVLTPSLGFDSTLGTNYTQEYYWAIDESKDATFGAMVATDVNPLLLGQYRQRFEDAVLSIEGGVTYSDRVALSGTRTVSENDEVRGHIKANALWNITNKWRAGIDSEYVSDDQYMRQYNFSTDDILENRIYAERFSGRNYAKVQALAFQDIRISQRQEDQPSVLPEISASFLGEPNATLGGRWSADVSSLSMVRDGDDQDLARTSAELGWERRFISDSGLVAVLDTTARGDLYYVSDRDIARISPSRSDNSTAARGFVQGNLETSYPLVNDFEKLQVTVEPVVGLTLGSNVNEDGDIPNEDSEDTVIDALNLFEANRFAGYDRIEDRARVTYGLRSGLFTHSGMRAEGFFGQSYRFDSDDNPFLRGSGLDEEDSDYVASLTLDLGPYLDVDYRTQLANDDFSSQRHELDISTVLGPLSFSTRYFYGVGIDGSKVQETREQLTGFGRYNLNDNWYGLGGFRYDFGQREGLRTATYGVGYSGQCTTVEAVGRRSLTQAASGDSATEILLRIGFKNLGEFQTSGISLSNNDSE